MRIMIAPIQPPTKPAIAPRQGADRGRDDAGEQADDDRGQMPFHEASELVASTISVPSGCSPMVPSEMDRSVNLVGQDRTWGRCSREIFRISSRCRRQDGELVLRKTRPQVWSTCGGGAFAHRGLR